MTAPKPKPLGHMLDVPDPVTVIRPEPASGSRRNGSEYEIIVAGGSYVLDVPGVHIVDGREIVVDDGTGATESGA